MPNPDNRPGRHGGGAPRGNAARQRESHTTPPARCRPLRADSMVVKRPRANVQPEVRGALAVAGAFAGRAAGAQTAMIDGFVGAVWAQGGRPRAVFEFRIAHGKIVSIEMVADPERLGHLELEVLS